MKHNTYSNGEVQNIEFTDNQSNKSVGVVEPGSYTFTTEYEETIQCLSGSLEINNKQCLPGEKIVVNKGESFTISTKETSSYLCLYR
ncbi:MAG: pyrimidine/purine nucleoside phosphorylase [bacterium]|nr:pyrimidine/purine nucleoside phosphorylase [bacterium]